jgi:hypothetical protein
MPCGEVGQYRRQHTRCILLGSLKRPLCRSRGASGPWRGSSLVVPHIAAHNQALLARPETRPQALLVLARPGCTASPAVAKFAQIDISDLTPSPSSVPASSMLSFMPRTGPATKDRVSVPTRFDSWSMGPIGVTTAGCSTQDGLARMCVSTTPCELVGDVLCRWDCLGRCAPYMYSSLKLYVSSRNLSIPLLTCYILWGPHA